MKTKNVFPTINAQRTHLQGQLKSVNAGAKRKSIRRNTHKPKVVELLSRPSGEKRGDVFPQIPDSLERSNRPHQRVLEVYICRIYPMAVNERLIFIVAFCSQMRNRTKSN